MKRLVSLMLVVGLFVPALAFGDDLIPPPWPRSTDGTTYAAWDTWDFEFPADTYLADEEFNPYGSPTVYDPNGFAEVLPTYDGRPDVLHLTGGDWLELNVPNNPASNDFKDIFLQVVWHWDGAIDIPDVYIPSAGSTVTITDEFFLDGAGPEPAGWW